MRPRRTRASCLALLLGCALCAAAFAEVPEAAVAGVVLDAATSAPIADAVVTARSPVLLGEQSAVTDSEGAFELTLLPPGTYSLSVQREGFEPFSQAGIAVKAGTMRVRIAVVAVPEVPAQAGTAVEFNPSMTAPAMISGPVPQYTAEAIERGIEGSMQIRCVVTVAGEVRACKVVKGLPFMNAAAVEALQRRKYKPALAKGKPVDVFYTFNIRLQLPAR